MAMCLAFTGAIGATAPEPPAMSIHDAFADSNGDGAPDRQGDIVTVTGVLLADPVALTGGFALANVQDSTGGTTLFASDRSLLIGRVQQGDRVVASGRVSVYRGSRELDLIEVGRIGRSELPKPRDVRIADILAGRCTGELVRVQGDLHVAAGLLNGGEPALRDATGHIRLQIGNRFFTNKAFLDRFDLGGRVTVVGVCDQFGVKTEYRLIPRYESDFEFVPLPPYRAIAFGVGTVVVLVVIAGAVRRRRQAERKARELGQAARRAAEERDRFFTLSLDLLCVAHMDGRLKRLNPAFTQTLGWEAEELLARPFLDFVHPDDAASVKAVMARLQSGGRISNFENRWRHRNGSWRVLSWRAVPQPDGNVYATARDVTEQREAEVTLRALNEDLERRALERAAEVRQALATLDATDDAALIFEPESLRFTYVNEGAVRQLGYSRTELLGMTALDVSPRYDEAAFRTLLAPLVRGEQRTRQITTFHRHKDGREFPVEINVQYVAPAGERPRFISMGRDLSERRKTDSLVRRAQRLDALGTLASGIAHDLNNALTPIMIGIGALKAEYPNDSRLIDTMQLSAARGAEMVRQLLTFAKRSEGNLTELAPGRLLEEVEQIARYTFPKNIRVELCIPPGLPSVRGDSTQLHQLLLNLCVNARDAMPEGGTLKLGAATVEFDAIAAAAIPGAAPGHYVVLRVSDTGTGIAPEILERIFDPFFTTKAPDKGTGLGLSTAIGIVRGHGGFLQVDSELGRGSTFAAFLPADPTAATEPRAAGSRAEFRGRKQKILLVDDEPAVRTVLASVLRRLNFEPVLATDGHDGLAQVAYHHPDAIITDLHMPNMGGLEFVRRLGNTRPLPPVIVTSGRMEEREREECSRAGVRAYIDKPFTERQLADTLKTLFA